MYEYVRFRKQTLAYHLRSDYCLLLEDLNLFRIDLFVSKIYSFKHIYVENIREDDNINEHRVIVSEQLINYYAVYVTKV